TNYWVDVDFVPTPTSPPGQVTNVSASAGLGSASVSWSAPASGGPVSAYTVTPYIGSKAQPTTTVSGSPPATNVTISGLTGGTTYTFTVQASNADGSGAVSEPSNAVTPTAPTAPSAPTGVTATAGNGSATVIWTAPSNGGSPITSYTVTPYVGATAQAATTVSGSPPATSATIGGLTNGTTYTFTVTAANAVGAGPPSSPSNAVTPTGSTIAYPDLQVLVPTAEIYITQPEFGTRMLEFEHNTANLGTGPWEVRPVYNSKTGISQGYQALYTSPSPGVWTYDHSVPIVGPMIWSPPSDYRFPLDKFWLYSSTPAGGLGSVVATSPKLLFCMTSDAYVGGVPNTPSNNGYPGSNCEKPEGTLGLSVGWGDEYDATDGGEGIPITSLANGTYWLRAEVDPYHYFQESNTANDITDTKVQIEGTTVKVLEQTHPDSTPPTVTLTSPSAEATVSGTATLTATAGGPHPIGSVQFLLDGEPLGAPVTAPPYTMKWTLGSTPVGKHLLSAQATDSEGFIGTAADLPITVKAGSSEEEHDTEPPKVSIVNPVAGQTVSGTVQVSANASDNVAVRSVQFYLDGKALGEPVGTSPYAVSWDTTTATNAGHTLTAVATDTSGNVGEATPVNVTVQNPAEASPCFVMDVKSVVDGHGTVTTPSFTTAEPGEQLFAFVSADGPAGAGKQSATVSGAGLVWTLVKRANSRSGDAEIWAATALGQLSNVTVTSTLSAGGYDQSLALIAMQMSKGVGASVAAGAASGEPSVSLKTTEDGSLVFAVGNDYDNAIGRSLGLNQVLLHQDLDTGTGDTFWSQYTGQITGPAGETVTINDTAPTKDQWNMAAVEVLGDGPGN
ncbi:MAG TPA: Ig-like domain-containing protein, partial [Solirubrobacteraceae bacterium]|nr:Ig-like domain-containing protein [Solirubrobacteraceae bacterium]